MNKFGSKEFRNFEKRADRFFGQVYNKKDADADYEEFKRNTESLNSKMESNKKKFDSQFEAVNQMIDDFIDDVKEEIASSEAEKEKVATEETTLSREEILDQIDRIQLEIESDQRVYEILKEQHYIDAALELHAIRFDEHTNALKRLLSLLAEKL